MKNTVTKIYLFNSVPFHDTNTPELIKKIITLAFKKQKASVLNMNAYGVSIFLKNQLYASIIKKARIIYSDGWGPVLLSKIVSTESLHQRTNVGDFIFELLEIIQRNKLSIFLLGTDNETLNKTVKKIHKQYPNLVISGFHSGFFKKKEEKKIVASIKQSEPDIVLIGMGIPKQEIFIEDHWKVLPSAVYMGVGGVFHYIAGTKSRAPQWMRNYGFEWVYRLIQEPKRLFKRYTLDNLYLLYYSIKYLLYTFFGLRR